MCFTTFAFFKCTSVFYVTTHTMILLHCAHSSLYFVVLFARWSIGMVVICNSNVVRPGSIVTDVLVLNKRQNISDHRVDYIVSLGLYGSYCSILILLGRDSICFRSPKKTPVPFAICRVSAQNPASVSPTLPPPPTTTTILSHPIKH